MEEKYNEIKSSIIEAMKNPDTLETSMGEILKNIESDYNAFAELSGNYEKAQTRIRDLQDTNHKLFLAQVGTPDEAGKEDPELPKGNDVIQEFINKVNDFSKEV